MMASFLSDISPPQLQRLSTLLHSIDPSVHAQGLELLATLAPPAPDALRGALVADLPPDEPLSGRDLCGAQFRSRRNLSWRFPEMRGARLVGATLYGDALPSCDLREADLRCCCVQNTGHTLRILWEQPQLDGADLRWSVLGPMDWRGVDLLGPGWAGVDLRGADLQRADLRGGRFRGVDFSGVDFSGANMSGANMKDAILRGADLTGTDLYRANLKGADLTGATMEFDETIRWDARTRWPEGLAPPAGTRPSRRLRCYPV